MLESLGELEKNWPHLVWLNQFLGGGEVGRWGVLGIGIFKKVPSLVFPNGQPVWQTTGLESWFEILGKYGSLILPYAFTRFYFTQFFFFWPRCVACGVLVPHQGSNLRLLHWECGVLTPDQQGSPRFLMIGYFNTDNMKWLAILSLPLLVLLSSP